MLDTDTGSATCQTCWRASTPSTTHTTAPRTRLYCSEYIVTLNRKDGPCQLGTTELCSSARTPANINSATGKEDAQARAVDPLGSRVSSQRSAHGPLLIRTWPSLASARAGSRLDTGTTGVGKGGQQGDTTGHVFSSRFQVPTYLLYSRHAGSLAGLRARVPRSTGRQEERPSTAGGTLHSELN